MIHGKHTLIPSAWLTLGMMALAPAAQALDAGDAAKGKTLHDRHCAACHDTRVYTRPDRGIKTVEGLDGRVKLCNKQIGLKLNRDELRDITAYLNKSFYKFDQ